MKTRQFFLLLLALVLILTTLACTPQQNDPPAPGTTEESRQAVSSDETSSVPVEPPPADVPGYTYTVSDGAATITGYTGEDKDLVFPSFAGGVPVTAIAPRAFANNRTIESVTLPGTIVETGEMAFYGCASLRKVVLSEGITTVGWGTFNECAVLTEVSFPSTLRIIYTVAFQGSRSLTGVVFPDSLTYIGYRAFANSGLTAVVTPESCTTVEEGAFANCRSLKTCEIRGQIPRIEANLFRECLSLESVVFPGEIDTVGEYAFYRCAALKELDLGQANYLYNYVLWGCQSLEKVYFHTTKMDRVGERVFAFVPNLQNIYYAGTMESWTGMRRLDGYNEALPYITINADWNGEK